MRQEFFLGQDGINALGDWVRDYAPRSVLVVTGEAFYHVCGAEAILSRFFSGIKTYLFTDFSENPKWEDVQKGLGRLRELQVDAIFAVGGGSVLDMAKLMRFFHSYEGDPTGKVFKMNSESLPLFALPTTAGTGAEATRFAVCYVDGTKYSVEHDSLLPDFAVIYPPFTYGNPRYLTACTAFDALAQAIESYWSVGATQESEEYSLKALDFLWPNICPVVLDATPQIRERVAQGAYWAGRAINIAKTTAPHAFSYQFTSHCGYPHGHAVSLTFPFFFDVNLNAKQSDLHSDIDYGRYSFKMQTLRDCLGMKKGEEITVMDDLIKKIELVSKGFGKHNVSVLLSKVNLQRLNNNPVRVDDGVIASLEKYLQS